jgi:hypothetical protein
MGAAMTPGHPDLRPNIPDEHILYIEVRELRKLVGMQDKADKIAFDHALIDLQNTVDIVISGVAENRNGQGKKSGWDEDAVLYLQKKLLA